MVLEMYRILIISFLLVVTLPITYKNVVHGDESTYTWISEGWWWCGKSGYEMTAYGLTAFGRFNTSFTLYIIVFQL